MRTHIALLSGIAVAMPTTAAFVVDGNLAAVIGAALSTVGLTIVVLGWLDKRIDHKIRNAMATMNVQHYVTLREVSNLRVLMGHPELNILEILKAEGS